MILRFSFPFLFCVLLLMNGRIDAAEDHDHHIENEEVGLFTIDELRGFNVGKKLAIFLPIRNHSLYPPNFLPKQIADSIPFSLSQASTILQLFSVSPDSPKGKAVLDTLNSCELKSDQFATKICATSLESMFDFLRKSFGSTGDVDDLKYITTNHPTLKTPILQNYTVLEPPREIQSGKKAGCHHMPYLNYAVYFCHYDSSTETKAFKLRLVGDSSGDEVDALVVCHMDTSGWSPNHVAFRMLGMKHGNSVCHLFRQGDIIWIQFSTSSSSSST